MTTIKRTIPQISLRRPTLSLVVVDIMFAGLQLTFVTTFYADPRMCVSKVDNKRLRCMQKYARRLQTGLNVCTADSTYTWEAQFIYFVNGARKHIPEAGNGHALEKRNFG